MVSLVDKNSPDVRRELNVKEARLRVLQQKAWNFITLAALQRKRKNHERALKELL